jgi:hypothetical protein
VEQGRNGGREADILRSLAVIQRLFAEAIPGEQEGSITFVPKREREHTLDTIERADSVVLKHIEEDLGVRLRMEHVSAFKFPPERSIVVDLAIKNEPTLVPRIGHRLIRTVREIDYSEPVMPKEAARILVLSIRVRSPAFLNSPIAAQPLPIESGDRFTHNAEDSAH